MSKGEEVLFGNLKLRLDDIYEKETPAKNIIGIMRANNIKPKINRCCFPIAGCWLYVAGCWLLLLVAGCRLLVAGGEAI